MTPHTQPPAFGMSPTPATPFAARGLGVVVRAGLLVSATGAILASLAPVGDLAEGPSRLGFGSAVQEPSILVTVLALIGLALLIVAAAMPWSWAHYSGIAIAATLASFYLFFVIVARTDDELFEGAASITLKGGSILLILAALVTMAGVVVALVGNQHGAQPDPADFADAAGKTSGKAIAALALGVVSSFSGLPTAPLAVAFATRAGLDIQASGNRLGGRRMAIAGLVSGIVFLVLWFGGLLLMSLFLEPPKTIGAESILDRAGSFRWLA